jgi:hypothetical protein
MKTPESLIKTPEKRIGTFRILYWQIVKENLGVLIRDSGVFRKEFGRIPFSGQLEHAPGPRRVVSF